MYPRAYSGEKMRFCYSPWQLGLHTKCFKMYFVSITDPRQYKQRPAGRAEHQGGMLQLLVLFIRSDHGKIDYCDQHFLPLNKANFQPFQYSPLKKAWYGYGHRTIRAFHRRGVKVNIAVAGDLEMLLKGQPNMAKVWEEGCGWVQLPRHPFKFGPWDFITGLGLENVRFRRNYNKPGNGLCILEWPVHHREDVACALLDVLGLQRSEEPFVRDPEPYQKPTGIVLVTLAGVVDVQKVCDRFEALQKSSIYQPRSASSRNFSTAASSTRAP